MAFIRSSGLVIKFLFVLFALTSCCRTRFIPRCIISSDIENKLYLDLESTIRVSVERQPCKEISLSGENVKIIRESPNSCEFRVTPLKEGELTLYLSARHGKDSSIVYTRTFRIRRLPYKATLKINSPTNDSIALEELPQLNRLFIYLDLTIHLDGIKNTPLSFKVGHFRGDSTLKVFAIQGEYLTEEFNAYRRQSIKKGDHLIFFDIKAITPAGVQRINPMEVIIK